MKLADAEIEIAASPEAVFALFSTGAGLERWMAAEATVDLRPGGDWRWVHTDGSACSGTYLAIEPPDRLSFTYGWESGRFADIAPGSTRVDVTFEPTAIGTRVRVVHAGLGAVHAERHAAGWTHFLGELASLVTHQPGHPPAKEHDMTVSDPDTGDRAAGRRDPGHDPAHERFWAVAEPLLATGTLVEGRMMGHRCLRAADGDGFVATVHRATGDLVVKLPADRVAELVATGEGREFAPAGKVFREWVAIGGDDAERWGELLDESLEFVRGGR